MWAETGSAGWHAHVTHQCSIADARFIAAARTAVPELLDALDAAEATLARVEALAADWSARAGDGHLSMFRADAVDELRQALEER